MKEIKSLENINIDWEEYCKKILWRRPAVKYVSLRFIPVLIYRISKILEEVGIPYAPYFLSSINYFIFGLEISMKTVIDGGLVLPHPNGVVIGARSIGRNCTIYQQVTLGSASPLNRGKQDAKPKIGSNVILGAGAKILGSVEIEDNRLVRANEVIFN